MVDIPMIFGLTILTVTTSFLMIYIPIFQTCKNNYITPNLCGQYVQMLHPRSPKQRLTSFPAATETLDPASGFSVSSAFSSGSFSSTWHVWKGTTWENIGRFRGWRRRKKNMNNNIHDFHIPSFQWVQGFLDKIGLGCLPDLPWINMLSKPGGSTVIQFLDHS